MTSDGTGVSTGTRTQAASALDEQVMAAGTTLRFVVLVLLFTVGSFAMLSYVVSNVSGSSGNQTGCALAAGVNPGASPWAADAHLISEPGGWAAYQACLAHYAPNAVGLPLAATGALVAMAFGLYWLLPAWKARRSRLMRLEEADVSGRTGVVVRELMATAGLTDHPPGFLRFAVNPAAVTRASAVVFGRRHHYTVCLDMGLLAECESNRFRAVVLHELAHIANGDVDMTYATVALWRVFFLVAVCPDAAVTADALMSHDRMSLSWGYGISDSYGLISLVLIVLLNYLAQADILRTREIYADLTSVHWGADRESWPGGPGRSGQRGTGMWFRLRVLSASAMEWWQPHPAWELRRQSLTDPQVLFAVSALPMFLTGVAADIATSELSSVLNPSIVREQFFALVVAALAVVIAGIALWRAVAYAVLTGRPVPSGLRAGLWLGAGVAISEFLYRNQSRAGGGWFPPHPETYLILIATIGLVLAWSGQVAELYVRAWRGRSLRSAVVIGLTGSWLVFTYMMYQWYAEGDYLPYSLHGILQELGIAGQSLAHPGLLLTAMAVVMSLPSYTPAFAGLWWIPAVLWLIPLLAWTVHRHRGRPEWQVRALPDQRRPPPAWDLPRLRRVCWAGLVGGGAACGGAAAAGALMNGIVRSGRYTSGADAVMYPIATGLAICGAMVLSAAVTVLLVRRYQLVAVSVAAGVTALAGLAGQYVLLTMDGCLGPMNYLITVCRWGDPIGRLTSPWGFVPETACVVLQFGIIAAGVLALGVMVWKGIGRAVRNTGRDAETSSQPAGPDRRVVVRRTAIGMACILTTGILVTSTAQSGLGLSEGSGESGLGTAAAELSPNAASDPSSTALQSLQAAMWINYGGGSMALGVSGALVRVMTVFTQKTITPRQLAAPCAALADTIQRAEAYFSVPDAHGEQLWSRLLSESRAVNVSCKTYMKAPTDADINALSNGTFANAEPSLTAFFQWFNKQKVSTQ